jgi:sulfide:quinone oxidoreductase
MAALQHRIAILGAGTAGTVMANRLARRYRKDIAAGRMQITVVDQDERHLYQPGLLFLPFGIYTKDQIVKPRRAQVTDKVEYVQGEIDRVEPGTDVVYMKDGRAIAYDVLIVATGTRTAPEMTEGMTGEGWHSSIFDFYTLDGADDLREKLAKWKGGKLVVNLVEMPIKCPVAPLEFAFLADWFFTERGMRDKVDITYVTPLDGCFTKPICTRELSHLMGGRNIHVVTEFATGSVDGANGRLVSYDERTVDFDILVTVPVHTGAQYVGRSPGLGNDMQFVTTDPHTLQSRCKPNIFAIGDATDAPTSKAGSVVHFQAEVLDENVALFLEGRPLKPDFDGHANCFIETGFGKGLMIDFNYETEPLPGRFPLPLVGLRLLKESRLNHWAKLAFRHVYWNVLLPGHDIPGVKPQMSMWGKVIPADAGAGVAPAAVGD